MVGAYRFEIGQSVRTNSITTTCPSDTLSGSTVVPTKLSGKLLCDVPGTTTVARLSPHTKMAVRIMLKADGFGLHIAVGNLPSGLLRFNTLWRPQRRADGNQSPRTQGGYAL